VADKYNKLLEKNLIRHNVDEDHRTAYFAPTKEESAAALAASEKKMSKATDWKSLQAIGCGDRGEAQGLQQ